LTVTSIIVIADNGIYTHVLSNNRLIQCAASVA